MDALEPRQGKLVTLVPYIRGISPRDTLLRWWLLMDQAKGQDKIFWGQTVLHENQRGDPLAFMEAFHHRFAYGVYDRQTEELIGFNWLEHIKPQKQAQYGLFYDRKAWGESAGEATELATTYAFGTLGLKIVWGFTPWVLAVKHVLKLGWHHEATLHGFAWIDGKAHDMYVMKLDVMEDV